MKKTMDDYIPNRDEFVTEIVPDLSLPPIAEDVCEFLSISMEELEELHDRLENGSENDDIMEQWERMNPDPTDAKAVAKVYEESERGYIIEQAYYDRYSYGKYLRCRDHVVGDSLLDYGSALGSLALYFKQLEELNVTAADLQSAHFDLARYRFRKHAPSISTIEIDPENPPRGRWNTIVSLDVLEHVPNWQDVLRAFEASQDVGDRFVLKIGFGGSSSHESLHISDENNLTPGTFKSLIDSLGYEITYQEENKFFVGEKIHEHN